MGKTQIVTAAARKVAGSSKAPTRLLQRKCACAATSSEGECEGCKSNPPLMQKGLRDASERAAVPPIVGDVLHSSGRPLDASTRAFFEPRFGHDFSKVRIHTDTHAAESAHAVNALAYTVGRDVVFGAAGYRPESREGRVLMAHELAHVIQQGASASDAELAISQPQDTHERQADTIANMVVETPSIAPSGGRSFATSINSQVHQVTVAPPSVARQAAAGGQRSRIQCINANLSNAGIPWAVLALAGGACGLLGAIAGLATGPGAPAASPSAAAVAAAYCIAAVTGASAGMILGVITRCIQDPSVEWVFAQNETDNAGAGAPAVTPSAAPPADGAPPQAGQNAMA